jgi:hypothetical protein
MKGRLQLCICVLIAASLAAWSLPAQAQAAPRVTGSYQVIHHSDAGGETHLRLQLHLVNHSGRDLHIQRITLWDLTHAVKGGTQACSVVLHSASRADTTQEFTIPHAQDEMWRRGARPRLVLEVAGPDGRVSTEAVRLDRASGGKGN